MSIIWPILLVILWLLLIAQGHAHLGAMYFIMATIIHAEISIVAAINKLGNKQ